MKHKEKMLYSLLIIFLILCFGYLFHSVSMMDEIEKSGTITMKWDISKLLVHRYYFEIDNETKLNVDSYDYHKYDIDDMYTWETWE